MTNQRLGVVLALTVTGCNAMTDLRVSQATPQGQSTIMPGTVHRCAWDTERVAFAYQALQTQMMEAALSCGQEAPYNRFVNRYRPALLDSIKQITMHFARINGDDGEAERDAYITDLANVQSQGHGPTFCELMIPLVDEAVTLESGAEVAQFVADHQIATSDTMVSCTETASH
jgi:hypothetical protein